MLLMLVMAAVTVVYVDEHLSIEQMSTKNLVPTLRKEERKKERRIRTTTTIPFLLMGPGLHPCF